MKRISQTVQDTSRSITVVGTLFQTVVVEARHLWRSLATWVMGERGGGARRLTGSTISRADVTCAFDKMIILRCSAVAMWRDTVT